MFTHYASFASLREHSICIVYIDLHDISKMRFFSAVCLAAASLVNAVRGDGTTLQYNAYNARTSINIMQPLLGSAWTRTTQYACVITTKKFKLIT